jgi:nucleoid-associated protein YgaU
MRSRRWLPVAFAVAVVLLTGCAGRQGDSSLTAGDNPTIAKAKAEEAKARAAEAKSKAEEAAARAEKAKADAKRARSDAARAAKSPAGASSSPAAGSSYSSPSIWISCNPENYTPSVHFSGDWQFSTSTARLFIDYGDGRHYTTSHIPYFRSAYRHTYTGYGTFSVTIRLTDGRGNTATDSCVTGYYIYD